jgi:GDP-L-fucose synthase
MNSKKLKIFVAGHKGMLGAVIFEKLKIKKNIKIYTQDKKDLNLLNQKQVNSYFIKNKFDMVYLCAARVGGILANKIYPADFIYENLTIQTNVIHAAYLSRVKKLLFVGSTCIYPKFCKQPLKEEYLLSSKLEESNEPYAVAKIAGIKTCESYNRQYQTDFRSVMAPNMYGVGDSFDPEKSHVISGLIGKIYNAKINSLKNVKVWGTGKPIREFLYVDDAADICIKVLETSKLKFNKLVRPNLAHINIGNGYGITIKKLAELIKSIIGYKGKIYFDPSYPDGHPKKVANITKQLSLGIKSRVSLKKGIKSTYNFYITQKVK